MGVTRRGSTDSTAEQGVLAFFEDESFTRLGIYLSPEFTPGPYGSVVGELIRPLDLPNDSLGATVTGAAFTFTGFDGDINGDGMVCADDKDLMITLVSAGGSIGAAEYTPFADLCLNGVIDAGDEGLFQAIFAQLPDCNNNGNPDSCDIADGSSLDENGNGVPDECEVIIPTVSEWGLIVMGLLGLTAGALLFARRQPTRT
jgi:hypothetical protein